MKNQFDPTAERNFSAYAEAERIKRKSTPNLWKIPQMTPNLPPSVEEQLEKYQATYTELLYSVGEKKYDLRRKFDFVVDVIIPTQNMQDLGLKYSVVGGPVVQLVMAICSVKEFEGRIHGILSEVKERLRTKSLEIRTKLMERSEELKKIAPPFTLYEELEGHHLEITIERTVTITDKNTRVTVSRTRGEEKEAARIMIHKARLELIEVNSLVKELEAQVAKEEANAQQINAVKI